jgi:hypothetical protein
MERRYDLIETKENSVMNMLQKATDKDMRRLKAEHRQALYALLKPREGSPDLCCTVLETILRMKDIEALPYLESALSGPVPFPSFARQLEAGIVVLREEKLRLQQSGTLLRASEPPISADTLLIPVMTQPGSTPPEELLRPEIAPKSQGK